MVRTTGVRLSAGCDTLMLFMVNTADEGVPDSVTVKATVATAGEAVLLYSTLICGIGSGGEVRLGLHGPTLVRSAHGDLRAAVVVDGKAACRIRAGEINSA